MIDAIDFLIEYEVNINILQECYSVYNYTTGDEVGSFYEVEVEDLLKKIKEKEGDR